MSTQTDDSGLEEVIAGVKDDVLAISLIDQYTSIACTVKRKISVIKFLFNIL